MTKDDSGNIITFYSYKGGTGRSMMLANVAWVLASCGMRVLAIDWDLEAPGLNRYFHPFLVDKDLKSTEGVIDFITEYCIEAMAPKDEQDLAREWYLPFANILRYAVSLEWDGFPPGATLDFISAGKQSDTYAQRVASTDWQGLYERLGGEPFLDAVRTLMKSEYDYILIDSRTGVSDTAGICTIHLPDSLAVFFTLNTQSQDGLISVARSVLEQRPDIAIFPIPSRIDSSEHLKVSAGLKKAKGRFAFLVDQLPETLRSNYWVDVEIPYVPYYSYDEVLSVFADDDQRSSTVLASAIRISKSLTGRLLVPASIPEDIRLKTLRKFSGDDGPARREAPIYTKRTFRRQSSPTTTIVGVICVVIVLIALLINWPVSREEDFSQMLEEMNLPADMVDYLPQLDSLVLEGVRSPKNSIEKNQFAWIKGTTDLAGLSVAGCNVSDFKMVPDSVTSLDVSGTLISGLEGLPRSLTTLNISATGVKAIRALPQTLVELDISGTTVSRLVNLPSTLRSLNAAGTRIVSIEGLPPFLESLNISQTKITSLRGLTSGIKSLDIRRTDIRTLDGVPKSLTTLKCDNHLIAGTDQSLLRSVTDLTINDPALSSFDGLPRHLESLDVTNTRVSRLQSIPPNLKSLSIRGTKVGSLRGLPGSLKELDSANTAIRSLDGIPQSLEYLDISYNQIEDMGELPDSLRFLNASGTQIKSLAGLPPALEVLIVRDTKLVDLVGLPNSIRKLDISGSKIDTLQGLPLRLSDLKIEHSGILQLGKLPDLLSIDMSFAKGITLSDLPQGLVELSLSTGLFLNLKGLPSSVKQLRFKSAS